MTSPAIRRRAREAGIDLATVPGSGPGGGGGGGMPGLEAFLDLFKALAERGRWVLAAQRAAA